MLRSLCILFLVISATPHMASAQRLTDLDRSRFAPASFYNYSEAGDVTILVNVWGSVRTPGLYKIPTGTKMSTLLSLSGGPELAVNLTSRSNREITMRLLRREGARRQVIFEALMKDDVVVSDQDPELVDGDVLTVETKLKQKFSLRDLFPIVAAIGTVALAIDRITR